jgi:hypothetical protein
MTVSDAMARRQKRKPNTVKPMSLITNYLWNFLRPKLVNFKTTIVGIGVILMGVNSGWGELVALVNGGVPDMDILTMAGTNIVLGWGMIMARDADKTTLESIGAKELRKHGVIAMPINTDRKEGGR